MDTNKAETIHKIRRRNRCNHQSLSKEYVHGTPTGNYVCAICGLHLSAILRASSQ